ncbi:MAG: TIM barrel protein [Geminicoccaceae bacterium]
MRRSGASSRRRGHRRAPLPRGRRLSPALRGAARHALQGELRPEPPRRAERGPDAHRHRARLRINHVHLKDGKGTFPDFAFPPLGEGAIDFPALVEGLRRAGYDGALSVEYEAQVYGYRLTEAEILNRARPAAALTA